MESRRDVFQAVADPTRRALISFVAEKEQNLSTLAEKFSMTRQAISLHIKILEQCGVIYIVKEGRERFCRLQPEKLDEISIWISELRKKFEQRFNQLDNLLTNLKLKEDENQPFDEFQS
ncbi:MAG TPA: metalloregulator ArsR/SmtB family transcription factor [Lentimicrobium sp.]|nr:metalloregulator ArsR/SmtB family transcription factor [Lentimicrobium sp.]